MTRRVERGSRRTGSEQPPASLLFPPLSLSLLCTMPPSESNIRSARTGCTAVITLLSPSCKSCKAHASRRGLAGWTDGRRAASFSPPSLPPSAGVPVPLCVYRTCRRQTDGPRPRQSVRHSSPPARSLSLTRSSRPLVVRPDRRRPSRCRFHRRQRRRLLLLFALSLSPFSVLRLLSQPVSQSPSRPRRFSKWNLERERAREREESS